MYNWMLFISLNQMSWNCVLIQAYIDDKKVSGSGVV